MSPPPPCRASFKPSERFFPESFHASNLACILAVAEQVAVAVRDHDDVAFGQIDLRAAGNLRVRVAFEHVVI